MVFDGSGEALPLGTMQSKKRNLLFQGCPSHPFPVASFFAAWLSPSPVVTICLLFLKLE